MKIKLFFIPLFLWLIFSGWIPSDAFAGDWLEGANGHTEAFERARSAARPMIVYFYTDWCPYCRKFEKNVLTDKKVQKTLENFVLVRINPEDGAHENRLADEYRIDGFPSIFFSNPLQGQGAHEVSNSTRSAKDFERAAAEFLDISRKMNKEKKESLRSGDDFSRSESPVKESPDATLFLNDGRQIKGTFVSRDSKGITLRIPELGEVYFSDSEFSRLEKTHK